MTFRIKKSCFQVFQYLEHVSYQWCCFQVQSDASKFRVLLFINYNRVSNLCFQLKKCRSVLQKCKNVTEWYQVLINSIPNWIGYLKLILFSYEFSVYQSCLIQNCTKMFVCDLMTNLWVKLYDLYIMSHNIWLIAKKTRKDR